MWNGYNRSSLVLLRDRNDLPEVSVPFAQLDNRILAQTTRGTSLRTYNRLTDKLSLVWYDGLYRVYEDTFCVLETDNETDVLRTIAVLHTTVPFLAYSRKFVIPKHDAHAVWIRHTHGVIGIGRTRSIEQLEKTYSVDTIAVLHSYKRTMRIHLLTGYGDACAALHYDGFRVIVSFNDIISRVRAWVNAHHRSEEEMYAETSARIG